MNRKLLSDNLSVSIPISTHKPEHHMQILIEHTQPFSDGFSANRGEILRYYAQGRRLCYLLHSGTIALYRRGDGMLLNSERAPFILGISNQFVQEEHLYVRTLEGACISRLPLERFMMIVEKEHLWESLCNLLVYTASRVYEHCTLLSQLSAYEIIRFQLMELMKESDSVRVNITAANYIKGRTYLSRSGIMRILSNLRSAGYIVMEKGILLAITRLPEKY